MTIRKLIIIMVGCVMQLTILPQNTRAQVPAHVAVEFGADFISEFQTDFSKSNWVNLLHLHSELRLSPWLSLEAHTISNSTNRDERLTDDFGVFSNIEADGHTLVPSVLGAKFTIPASGTEISAGVRNMGEDYFVTPVTSLFTNSSCGIFPTLSANYDIASFPMASVGFNLVQPFGNFTFQSSVYSGKGYDSLTGRNNVFRFCPKSDGIFAVAVLNYSDDHNYYTLGSAVYRGLPDGDDVAGPAQAPQKKYTSFAPWINIEQCVSEKFCVIAQASVNLASTSFCRHYYAVGSMLHCRGAESGVILNAAKYGATWETDLELTSKIPVTGSIFLQPTCHVIRTGHSAHCLAMLRFGFSI